MLKARMTAEQIQLREGLEPTLVANKIASAVALGEGLPETFFDYDCVPQEKPRRGLRADEERQGRAR